MTANIISFLKEKARFLPLVVAFCLLPASALSQPSGLFDTDEVLEFTLKGDLNSVFKDRGDDSQYFPATIHYLADGKETDIPLKIKTRGHFRKMPANCKYPPILLNFAQSSTPENSVFRGQNKMKLVTPCRGDEYVIQEYLVYKLYNIVTLKSFNARLVKVIYHDTVKNKSSDPYYGILLEEENQMASRNQSICLDVDAFRPESTEKEDFLKMAVFQYMIGNTDWSVQYLQNIVLISADSTSLPSTVPYDFDHAGIVRAPYAKPAEELRMKSTLERRYRGYCLPDMEPFASVFDLFNRHKGDFYAVYEGNPLLSSSYIEKTLKFLDQFFDTINDPKKAEKAFSYPCDKSGTGNVVIKGLRK